MIYRLKTFVSLAFIILLFSCAEENPNLVNPVSLNQTVKFRFFNYAADKNSRQLSISGVKSQLTSYSSLSPAYTPPASDSLVLQTIFNDQIEYTFPHKFRIIRDQRYIVFSVPKAGSSNPADSLVVVGSSFSKLADTSDCFISLLNINNDPGVSYSLVMGCPNGPPAFPSVGYLQSSSESEVPSGNFPVSIVKIDASSTKTTIGLFDLNLRSKGEYLIVIMGDTPDKIVMINKQDSTAGALEAINLISSNNALIRTVNLTQKSISAKRFPDDNFLPVLSAASLSDYNSVTACESNQADSILINADGNYSHSILTNLVVNFKYTLIVYDSSDNLSSKSLIVPNLRGIVYPAKNAVIRVINLSEKFPAITLSLGARDDNSSASGYRSGEVLATNLNYDRISNNIFALSGRAPLTLFTASSPDRLLYTGISNFDEGKSYLIIISNDNSGNIKMNVISEDEVSTSVSNAEEGAFAQLANMTPGLNFAEIKIDNVLNAAKLFNSTSIATVLPLNQGRISIQGAELTYDSKKDYRDMFVIAGTKDNPDIIHIQNIKMAYNSSGFNRRFLNAALDADILMIYDMDKRIDTSIKPIITDLKYKSVSDPYMMTLERKYSYFFYYQPSNKFIKQINDISMTFGKNYTMIFGGDSTIISRNPDVYRYSIMLLQEY